jgi:pyruvate formate lyase activating enzyme
MPEKKGLIFDIHRFSIHDGPGIRTTVFFKGCPLNCWWCHNPESQSSLPEKLVIASRCVRCGVCAQICPEHGIVMTESGVKTDRQRCSRCGACVEACFADASEMIGYEVDTASLYTLITRDCLFYDESVGGVTFSGGEPLSQPGFLTDILRLCRANGMHTAVDTSGYAPWELFERIIPYTNLFLYDVKLMDDERHKHFTGVSNHLILENLKKISRLGTPLWIRFPLVPGINDDEENLEQMAAFLADIPGFQRLSLLPYHSAAESKYNGLEQTYALQGLPTYNATTLEKIKEYFQGKGFPVMVGG